MNKIVRLTLVTGAQIDINIVGDFNFANFWNILKGQDGFYSESIAVPYDKIVTIQYMDAPATPVSISSPPMGGKQ